MVDTHKAILALYPNVVSVDDTEDNNKVEIDQALVNAWVDPEAYKYQRVAEYPPHADYLDGIVKGDNVQVQKYIDDCLAVKAKYPKGNK